MASTSYTEKAITVVVALDGQSTATFSGYAVTASITKSGMPAFPTANVTIKGLSLEMMERMTFLAFRAFGMAGNSIQIFAGEKGGALSLVFAGNIMSAYADFNAAPSPSFKIEARGGVYAALAPQSPVAVKGDTKAADLVKSLAAEQGLEFENNGVTSSISNCTLTGGPMDKIRQIAEMVDADVLVDDDKVVLLARKTMRAAAGGVPLINAENGMIGYPAFSAKGITVSTFFRPDIRIGGEVQVESIVPRASGSWKVIGFTHDLSAVEDGPWKTTIQCLYPIW